MSGVTPAAMSLLLIHLKKGRFHGFARTDRPKASAEPDAAPQDAAA
jgi:tRNA uridine 5-carboxymethylaminomethyl modification enzyme